MNDKSNLFKILNKSELKRVLEKSLSREDKFNAKLLDGGLFNTTYLVEYASGDKFVLRLGPVNRRLILEFEENLMQAEDYAYKLCREKNLLCSEVVVCDLSKTLIDRDFMIVKYIESQPLSSFENYDEMKAKVYEQVGEYARRLHSIKSDSFGRLSYIVTGKNFSSWYDYISYEIDSILSKGVFHKAWDNEYKEKILKLFECRKSVFDEVKEASFVHSDLWEGNVLVNDGKLAAVIDHDRAIFGDVELEFACPWMVNEDFLKGYGERIPSENFELKKKLYLVFLSLIDAYVWHSEYNGEENYRECLGKIDEIIKELG